MDRFVLTDAQWAKIGAEMYKWRHLIENIFCKLKEFQRTAMRTNKTDQSPCCDDQPRRSSDAVNPKRP